MSNLTLRNAAIAGITDDGYESAPGMCERFFRQVSESVYGDTYASYYQASARQTSIGFRSGSGDYEAALGVPHGGLQLGDVLFKEHGSGDFGHVGIYVGQTAHAPDSVAENSSTHIGRIDGAKGYRSLAEWGHIDVVVRFPDPATSPRLIVARTGPSAHWIYSALASAEWDAVAHHWTVNESTLGGFLGKAGTMTRLPIREAAAALGYNVVDVNDKMGDADDPRMYVFLKAGE